MGIDYSTLIYKQCFTMYARPVTITPVVSQPGGPAYTNRGIFHTTELDVGAEDGSLVMDQRTELDIREFEYGVLPQQGDLVTIPADTGAMGALGSFEIIGAWTNGGGQTTLNLRKIMVVP